MSNLKGQLASHEGELSPFRYSNIGSSKNMGLKERRQCKKTELTDEKGLGHGMVSEENKNKHKYKHKHTTP